MNRKIMTGIGIAVACLVAVLVVVSLTSSKGDPDPANLKGIVEAKALVSGVQASGASVGDPKAPVEVVEFGDLACPACKAASETTIPALVADQVKTGKVRYRFSPIAFIHPQTSERGALGVQAAAKQDAGLLFAEAVYANQGDERRDWLSEELMESIVSDLGLDLEKWRADYASEAVVTDHQASEAAATAAGVNSTPTFVITGPGGSKTLPGVQSPEDMAKAIAAVS